MNNLAAAHTRLYYVDWLRVLAMVAIFIHHNARFFNAGEDWHVKNATTNMAASIEAVFNGQWAMPLFFLIAGASTYYALKTRQAGQYVQERTLRLLIPFIFGILVIVVPQAYYEAISHGVQLSQYNLFQIYGLYLQSLPDMNTFHLWFLEDLFLLSIVTLPLFLSINSGESITAKLSRFFDKPWALLLLLVMSITIVNVFVYPDGFWGYRNGGWNIISYLLFFFFGYLIFANQRIMETVNKLRWVFLTVGILTFAFILWFVLSFGEPTFGTPMYVFGMLVQAAGAWGWLLAILGFGSQYLNRNNRFLSYANETVLPFYVLHQTIIISIGFYVVQWNTGVGLKYLTISTTSFIAIMLIYELLVRRINILRFLFGMRLKRKPRVALAIEG